MKRWETSPASRAVWRGALTTLCKEGKWNSEWLEKEAELVKNLDVIRETHQGSLMTLLVRGTNVDVLETVAEKDPVFAEALPLTLEEIFISETSLAGYEVGRLFGEE